MHLILSQHTKEIRTIHSETVNLQEHVSNVEKSTTLCWKNLQTYEATIIEMEDSAHKDNLLMFNLKEGAEGSNALCYIKLQLPVRIQTLYVSNGSSTT